MYLSPTGLGGVLTRPPSPNDLDMAVRHPFCSPCAPWKRQRVNSPSFLRYFYPFQIPPPCPSSSVSIVVAEFGRCLLVYTRRKSLPVYLIVVQLSSFPENRDSRESISQSIPILSKQFVAALGNKVVE